jgi:hypothetical protein
MHGHCTSYFSIVRAHAKIGLSDLAAVSAGLWLNIPDYDAPTQMVKPHERNTRYVDAVMTIPKVGHMPALLHLHVPGCMR